MHRTHLMRMLFILSLFIFCANTAQATALDIEYRSLTEDEKSALIDTADAQVIQTDDNKIGIQCFDVNPNGAIAIGMGSGSNCMIYVYDSSAVFQYGYRFCSDGDWGIVWRGDLIGIFFLRGNTFLFYNSSGTCVDVQKAAHPNRDQMQIKEILNRSSKEMGDKEYALERDINLGDTYSRLVEFDKSGKKTILYDITSEHKAGQILGVSAIICFFLAVIWGCIKKLKARESESR